MDSTVFKRKFTMHRNTLVQDVQGILNVGAPQVSSKVEDLVRENKSLKKGNKTKEKSTVDIKEAIHKINNFDLE